MVENRIRVLLFEDDSDDVWMMRNLLADHWDAPCDLTQVKLLSAAIDRCHEGRFDAIPLDFSLPDSQGLETFFAKLDLLFARVQLFTYFDDLRRVFKPFSDGYRADSGEEICSHPENPGNMRQAWLANTGFWKGSISLTLAPSVRYP